jgi:predicted phosphoribosyltransferase
MIYRDRRDAGRQLAQHLRGYVDRDDVVVLALPRGGVPVAFEVASALHAPLDIFLVRKLGVPGHEEYAMGAIATGGVRVLNDEVIAELGIDNMELEAVTAREQRELARRETDYRQGRSAQSVAGRTAILIDDGLATGASMRAAIVALRQLYPARVVVAVPVGAMESCLAIRAEADEVVCAATPRAFGGVGRWYDDFSQTDDAQVRALLNNPQALDRQHDGEASR